MEFSCQHIGGTIVFDNLLLGGFENTFLNGSGEKPSMPSMGSSAWSPCHVACRLQYPDSSVGDDSSVVAGFFITPKSSKSQFSPCPDPSTAAPLCQLVTPEPSRGTCGDHKTEGKGPG